VSDNAVTMVALDGKLVPLSSIPGVPCPVCGQVDEYAHVHPDEPGLKMGGADADTE
jgi:hypothetical protein